MRMWLERSYQYLSLFLLSALLACWSGASFGGGFIGANSTVSISIFAEKSTLPLNIMGYGPQQGGPYTTLISVLVKKRDGKLYAAPNVTIAVESGLSSGALYYLDNDPEHEICPRGETCPPGITVPGAYRRLAFKDTDGVVTGHFHAGSVAGTVIITASTQDPDTGKSISDSLTITVTGGGNPNNPPGPASVNFLMDSSPVYIQNNPWGTTTETQNTTKVFQIFVRDDFGQPIRQGSGSALRVELLPNRPNGGEWLSSIAADGSPQQGISVVSGLFGEVATMALHSGNLPGTVVIAATADRADNNVDNGIQMGITNYAMVSIGTGMINSLAFTGPFADVAFVRGNNLIACTDTTGACQIGSSKVDQLWNGIYNRVISVIASDPFGNPPAEGTPITFRLIDSPLDMLQNRYPDQGHGQFAITGTTGDPQEGGLQFFAPNRRVPRVAGDTLNPFVVPNGVSYASADPLCLLMLQDPEVVNPNPDTINALPAEGRPEYHVGSRIIIGRAGNMLTVNTPFNQVSQNVGPNIWWTVGCSPHKGNVSNFDTNTSVLDSNVTVSTDKSGVATVVMSYPANQVGRRFMVSAESNGGKVGAVLTHWYLGLPNGILTIVQPASLVSALATALENPEVLPINIPNWPARVTVAEDIAANATNMPVTLQVLDGGVCKAWAEGTCVQMARAPLPGASVTVDVVINDPTEAAAIAAEEALAKAQVAYDTYVAANPGVCDLILKDPEGEPEPRDQAKCEVQTKLATDLDTAKVTAAQARAVANQHTPTASVSPATLVSDGSGYIRAVLNVDDLPLEGSVDFFFSTIGPSVSTQTLQVTLCGPQSNISPCTYTAPIAP